MRALLVIFSEVCAAPAGTFDAQHFLRDLGLSLSLNFYSKNRPNTITITAPKIFAVFPPHIFLLMPVKQQIYFLYSLSTNNGMMNPEEKHLTKRILVNL